jgi:cytochrome c-type biogenesis protein CcmH/NrfG
MTGDLYRQAEQRYFSSDWAGAAELLEQVVAAEPRNLEAWVMLAAASRQLRRFARSAQAYERAIELDPENTVWRQHLVHVHEQAGRYDEAAAAEAEVGTGGPTPATSG